MKRVPLFGALLLVIAGAARAESPMREPLQFLFLADQLEFQLNDGEDRFRWEVEGWAGGDRHRLWLESEGELHASGDTGDEAETQLLYGRHVAPFWDLRGGVRHDRLFGPGPDRDRSFAVLDVTGLAPYWFEVTPALFLSDDGDLSARLTAHTDVLVTQRLVLQPRLELNAAAHDVPKFGVARGFSDLELGVRLRYEVRREFAPYVGVNWGQKLGNTADLARAGGEDVRVLGFVAGVRLWF